MVELQPWAPRGPVCATEGGRVWSAHVSVTTLLLSKVESASQYSLYESSELHLCCFPLTVFDFLSRSFKNVFSTKGSHC